MRQLIYTAGPWRKKENYHGDIEITADSRADMVEIAKIELGFDEPFESEQRANARLIAKSPEMKERLSDGVEHAELVVLRWSSGDLAGAVNVLEEWAEGAKTMLAEIEAAS